MALRRLREPLQQLIALMASLASGRARMRLVHDDEVRAGIQEAITTMLALDVVEADDRVREDGEEARREGFRPRDAWHSRR